MLKIQTKICKYKKISTVIIYNSKHLDRRLLFCEHFCSGSYLNKLSSFIFQTLFTYIYVCTTAL